MPRMTPKRNKYGAKPVTTIDGRFDSQREYKRWCDLQLLEKAGAISGLTRQVAYPLEVVNTQQQVVVVGKYVADFCYIEDGRPVVEDSKGVRTPLYRWKKKHFEAQYGQTLKET